MRGVLLGACGLLWLSAVPPIATGMQQDTAAVSAADETTQRPSPHRVGSVRLAGVTVFDSTTLLHTMETRAGRPLESDVLEDDIAHLLETYAEAGYPLAEVRVASLRMGKDNQLNIILQVDEHRGARLGRIILDGAVRTDVSFIERVAGLRPGDRLEGFSASALRNRMLETGLFAAVGPPQFRILPDSSIALVLPVEEQPPGRFNLALGYQPPSGDTGGRLIGSGQLLVRNLFGGGRQAEVQLRQLPERSSRVYIDVRDPLLAGLPVGAEAQFRGMQQDSTYHEQHYRFGVSYAAHPQLTALGFVRYQATRPGEAGMRLAEGRQVIARSDAWFAGLGARYTRLDDVLNPRQGLTAAAYFEGGSERLSALSVQAQGDTLRMRTTARKQMVEAQARMYVPALGPTQVLVAGLDARAVISPSYDRSDLVRFGGTRTLRGYDEERFLGRFAGRLLAEYRYQLGRRSYGYVFGDLGFLERPDLPGPLDEARRILPGYGLGMQFQTQVGLVDVSFAANPEEPLGIRVHAGLSMGL